MNIIFVIASIYLFCYCNYTLKGYNPRLTNHRKERQQNNKIIKLIIIFLKAARGNLLFIYSFIHSFIHLFINLFTYSFIHVK